MNLADTQSARPPAMRRGGQQFGHTWDFSDFARLLERPILHDERQRAFYLAVIENARTECTRFGTFGFRHEPHGWRGKIERHEYETLMRWALGAQAPITLQQCCDVLNFDAEYVGQGLRRLAQRLGAAEPMPVHGPTSRRYISRGMRVGLT